MQEIPLIDIREGGPAMLLEQHMDAARALIASARRVFGRLAHMASFLALPAGDAFARRWLAKTGNPYREEITAFAKRMGTPGVYALNLAYEFGCTSGVYMTDGGPRLLRVLDWPFEGLGRHMVVAHQQGAAGEFHNVTWPGMSGILSAMAKGRFAAAINQAPMRRHRTGIHMDWARNRLLVWRARGLPPMHLLRKACENAASYEDAKEMLLREPVCIPVIYVLAGTKPGEACVIERLEEGAALRELGAHPHVSAANHFLSHLNGIGYGWRPREIDSCGRAVCAGLITGREAADPAMRWFRPPIANINSRLCLSMNAATGALSLMGTEGETPVTELFRLKD